MGLTNLNTAIDKARSRRNGESRAVHLLPSNPIAPYVRAGMGGFVARMNWDCRTTGLLPAVVGSLHHHNRDRHCLEGQTWQGLITFNEKATAHNLDQSSWSLYAEIAIQLSYQRSIFKETFWKMAKNCQSDTIVIAAPDWCYGTDLINTLDIFTDSSFIPIVIVNTTILRHQLEATIKASMGGLDIPESKEEAERIIEQHLPFDMFVNGTTP